MHKQAVCTKDYFKMPNPGLKAMFGRIRSGADTEFRTPFYNGLTPSQVVSNWMPHLEEIRGQWPGLFEFEVDLASKVGPMSIMKPLKDRMGDIESYWKSISLDSEPIDKRALDALVDQWSHLRGMTLKSQKGTLEDMKLSTNSGSPYFTKKRNVIDDTYPVSLLIESKNYGDEIIQNLNHETYKACAVLGWRGQEGGPSQDNVKQRVVWMMPFSVNIEELRYYQVLIKECQRNGYVPGWISNSAVDAEITRLFDSKGDKDLILCTDFTKFDQHFGPACQEAGKYLISKWLNNDRSSSSWLETVYPIKYNIPLMYDDGKMIFGLHGMGSGSGGTLGDETPVHKSLQIESALKANAVLNPHSMCLGDDGVLSFKGLSVEHVVDCYTSHGLEMNIEKQSVSNNECIYLRRWHHKDYRKNGICVGVYSTCRALGKLCEQERYINGVEVDGRKYDYSDIVILRSLSILENISFHPLRESFVDYCIKGDKYRLGLAVPHFFDNLERSYNDMRSVIPDFDDYIGSIRSESHGINDWWIVQYLKSKL